MSDEKKTETKKIPFFAGEAIEKPVKVKTGLKSGRESKSKKFERKEKY